MSKTSFFPALLPLAFAALAACLPATAARAGDSVVVLMYHRFGEPAYPLTNTPLELFERQLETIEDGGYSVLPLGEIVSALESGEPLPERSLAITVDDAYLSVYREAWPRLKTAGYPFTLFMATEPVDAGAEGFLGWDELREMAADPLVTIGSQTASHPHMPRQTPDENRADILAASARFEAELGSAPRLFAYPYGEYDLASLALVEELGFALAFSQQSGAIDMALAREKPRLRYALPRFVLNAKYGQPDRFRLATESLPLPVGEETPESPMVDPGAVAVDFAFTVAEGAGDLAPLRCYANWGGAPEIGRDGRRVSVRVSPAPGTGRWRVNCTLPAGDGRWYWYARLFVRAPE